jgi:hypothetical protein
MDWNCSTRTSRLLACDNGDRCSQRFSTAISLVPDANNGDRAICFARWFEVCRSRLRGISKSWEYNSAIFGGKDDSPFIQTCIQYFFTAYVKYDCPAKETQNLKHIIIDPITSESNGYGSCGMYYFSVFTFLLKRAREHATAF